MNYKFKFGGLNVQVEKGESNPAFNVELKDIELEVTDMSIVEAAQFVKELGSGLKDLFETHRAMEKEEREHHIRVYSGSRTESASTPAPEKKRTESKPVAGAFSVQKDFVVKAEEKKEESKPVESAFGSNQCAPTPDAQANGGMQQAGVAISCPAWE